MCYGSVQYIVLSSTRACFIKKLQKLLEDEYEDFESLDKVEKSSYVVSLMDCLVREYIIDVWEIRKHKLYMIVTQDPVNNSILSLHLGRGMVSSVRMVS